jgi:hypothetical protein
MGWKEYFYDGCEMVLATSSKKGETNAIVVFSLGFEGDKLLIPDFEMEKTIENIKENDKIAIIADYYRILGKAKVFKSGKYYDLAIKKTEDSSLKNIIVIDVDSVFDMYNYEILFEKK